jgi:hypothetical protein
MPVPKTPEDIAAKHRLMTAFFDDALARVDFLSELRDGGRDTEAFTLCLTYVDSFSQWLLWPREEVGRNFVEALATYEASPYFGLVHPLQAIRAFGAMKGIWPSMSALVQRAFPGPSYELLHETAFEGRLAVTCSPADLSQIRGELWRATIGGIAYFWLRNPSVHRFGSSRSLSFGSTTYNGAEPEPLTLRAFLPPLRAMIGEARKRSETTLQWFGDDRIMFDA